MSAANLPSVNLADNVRSNRALYPEIFYKLQPFISMTADIIADAGVMPNEQEMDDITGNILEDFINMYPDMAGYVKSNDSDRGEAVPTIVFGGGFGPGRRRFRRRGIGRDLILALLLSDLAGRRSRYPFSPYSYHPYFPY
jgi:hypothetical protein